MPFPSTVPVLVILSLSEDKDVEGLMVTKGMAGPGVPHARPEAVP